jgi:hypothetical protein
VRLHDQGSCGRDHPAGERQLIVAAPHSTRKDGNQFHFGHVSKNLVRFCVHVVICADQCNVDLFREASSARGRKPAAAAHQTRARASNWIREIFYSQFIVIRVRKD